MSSATTSRLPSWLVGSGVIAFAMGAMNLTTYAFTVAAARLLGPGEYGALAAVMGLLLVLNVLSLGVQATAARRVSADPHRRSDTELEVIRTSYRAALTLSALTLLAAPVVTTLLRLDSWLTAVLLAVSVAPLTVMGGQAGVFQGERRWLPLAGIYLGVGLGRVVFGLAGLLAFGNATGAMLGVTLGAFVPALVGWWALRHPSRHDERSLRARETAAARPQRQHGPLLVEVVRNSHALLAFFALSNLDVLIARSVLSEQQSGLYAGGLILAKAVLFLPQFIVVVAFPSMAGPGARRGMHLKALALVLAIGAATTSVAWLLAPLAIEFIGGDAYAELESVIWAFAGVGTLLTMIQTMVYAVVARQHRRAVYVVWAGLVALACLAPVVASVAGLLLAVGTVLSTVLVVLVLLTLRPSSASSTAAA